MREKLLRFEVCRKSLQLHFVRMGNDNDDVDLKMPEDATLISYVRVNSWINLSRHQRQSQHIRRQTSGFIRCQEREKKWNSSSRTRSDGAKWSLLLTSKASRLLLTASFILFLPHNCQSIKFKDHSYRIWRATSTLIHSPPSSLPPTTTSSICCLANALTYHLISLHQNVEMIKWFCRTQIKRKKFR